VLGVVGAPRWGDGRATFLVALAGLAIAAVACSPSPIPSASSPASTVNASGQASAINPCELVTTDEANTLLSGATQRTGPTERNRLVECTWDTGQGANLRVSVGHGAELYDPDLTNPGWQPVSGVGDKAFSDATTQTVGFLKSSVVVVLYVPAVQPVDMADLETLARTVAGRLASN